MAGIARSDQPARDQFGFRVNCSPGPNVSETEFALVGFRDVFFLGITERPNLIELQAMAFQIPKFVMLVMCARLSRFDKQLDNAVDGNSRHASGTPHAAAFRQGGKNLDALLKR